MIYRISFIFTLFYSISCYAQEELQLDAFVKEIKEDIKDHISSDSRWAGNRFLGHLRRGVFDDSKKELILQLFEQLRRKRFNDAEDFYDLFQIFNNYAEGNITDSILDSFLKGSVSFVPSLKHKTSIFYIHKCALVLVDSILFSTPSYQWKFGRGDISFTFDSFPKISSKSIDLYCRSKSDTIVIYQSSGYMDILSTKWYGESGNVDWTKHNISNDSLRVSLKAYIIDLRRSNYESIAVLKGKLGHNKEFINGSFRDGLNSNPKRIGSAFPSFISDQNSIFFRNIFNGVNAKGAIEISGKRIFLFSPSGQDVELEFIHDDKPFIYVHTNRFRFEDSRIYAKDVRLKISWKSDSIFHPELNLFYNDINHSLVFERDTKGLGMSPIRSSFHQLDCYFDRLKWEKDSSALYFSNDLDPDSNPALLESFNFYDESRYTDTETFALRHPAFVLRSLQKNNDNRKLFSLNEVSKYYKYSLEDTHLLMTSFAILGLVDYDFAKELIFIGEKLDFLLDARLGKIDYDGIRFISRSTSIPSAKMSLSTGDLSLYGVNMVELSDSNQVAIFPANDNLVIHKNRDFTFDGLLQSGRFGLFGKEMKFFYDPFVVAFDKIDSLQYLVSLNGDSLLYNDDIAVKTVISDLKGKFCIDHNTNKSGLESRPKFPILFSEEEAHVYYNKIKNGVYKKDLFSFKVDPFVLDSLLEINTGNLEFPGFLNAPTIFPPFRDTLRLNSAFELSFSHIIPGRYLAYEGRGEFTNKLYLDNNGLHGKGAIYYLNSETFTDSIYFYPFRALAHAESHYIYSQKSTPDCPNVFVEDASIDWRAFEDQIESRNRDFLYSTYEEGFNFDGSMVLSPNILIGSGNLFYYDAISTSPSFIFQRREFTANQSKFSFFESELGPKIINGNRLFSVFNFDSNIGSFESLDDSAVFKLYKNEYLLYFDRMVWNNDNQIQNFVQVSENKALLRSISKSKDSHSFNADVASLDLETFILDVDGVDEIYIPPVHIEPDSFHIRILANGDIDRLHNAKLSIDTDTKTKYSFYDAEVDIFSSVNFKGSAIFDYKYIESYPQQIKFSSLIKDKDEVTGIAILTENDQFHLDPYFNFQGKVILSSLNDFLTFDGDVNVALECDNLNPAWIPFIDQVDPENVFVDLNSEQHLTPRQQWHTGIMMSHKPTCAYPVFLSNSKRMNDSEILSVKGFVVYDKSESEYVISSMEKIENRSLAGNIAIYNPEKCSLYAEGYMNLGANSGLLNMGSFGYINAQFNEEILTGTLDLSFDFLFHKKASKILRNELKTSEIENNIDQSSEIHQTNLKELLGKRLVRKFNRKKRKGKRFLPKLLRHTLYFPQLELSWHKPTNSFVSDSLLPLSNVMGKKVDLMVPGFIQIIPYPLGDETNIYIEIDSNTFYFFSYRRGLMTVFSSNSSFNQLINTSPVRMSKKNGSKNNYDYRFELANQQKFKRFLNTLSELQTF
jgi:hypothetical protein